MSQEEIMIASNSKGNYKNAEATKIQPQQLQAIESSSVPKSDEIECHSNITETDKSSINAPENLKNDFSEIQRPSSSKEETSLPDPETTVVPRCADSEPPSMKESPLKEETPLVVRDETPKTCASNLNSLITPKTRPRSDNIQSDLIEIQRTDSKHSNDLNSESRHDLIAIHNSTPKKCTENSNSLQQNREATVEIVDSAESSNTKRKILDKVGEGSKSPTPRPPAQKILQDGKEKDCEIRNEAEKPSTQPNDSFEILPSDSDDDFIEVEDYVTEVLPRADQPSTSKSAINFPLSSQNDVADFNPSETLELLEKQRKAAEGAEKSMTEQIYEDCQSLLKLFGVPFLVAPGEAEAQCAWLEAAGLVTATLTEDSDTWLFGSKKVYRNVFNREKHAQFYSQDDIRNVLGLSREKMVQIAILTGCDYTDGVENVGVVAALEILAEFRDLAESDEGLGVLQRFHDWWQEAQRGKFAPGSVTSTKMKLSKLSCVFPPSFPDSGVWDAYLKPNVDHSSEKFTWGMPNTTELKDFLHRKVGWTEQKVNELLLPLLDKLKSRSNQTHISSFMIQLAKDPAQMKISNSKRVELAVKKLKTPSPMKKDDIVTQNASKPEGATPTTSKDSSRKKPEAKNQKKTATRKPKTTRKRKVPVPQIQAPKVNKSSRASKTKAASKIVDLCISESSSSDQDGI